ncbi:MAG: DUF6788 family protein, partial [Dermatophilaceae bacterium]
MRDTNVGISRVVRADWWSGCASHNQTLVGGLAVVPPLLSDLEQQRAQLYAELVDVGDFRRGSITENYRRCGKG